MSNQSKSPFLDSVRDLIRVKHLSYRTEEAYLGWIRRFFCFIPRQTQSGLEGRSANLW